MTTLAPTMNKDEITVWIVDMLHEMFELDKAKISPQSNLYTDLDIDSIDAVDIVVKLNQMTGKRIQPDVFRSVRTVQDVVNVIATLLQTDEKA
ncbi:acyl carrier protein [Herbaspirillum sp. meg3]|jgi:acyl carrier protein|uniref:acyl carrier protein n=1 Tax=Herbaspirillum sp. meg3 TaxID=2025949 RepID=UPI000B999DB1|nr:acyl carrier protein [Herbaspirillum sp. meg3]ASU39670.1 acyl carrier protein [Herbaspirillum sp. meg3]